MNIKKLISTILVILWMIIVFYFSHQQGTGSSNTSKKVSKIVVEIIDIKNEMQEEQKQEIIKIIELIIRKLAHYTIYLIGGIFITNCVYWYILEGKRTILYGASIGIIYAITDEIHQLFIPERSGKITDVLIDTIGIFTGILIYLFMKKLIDIIIEKKKCKGGE